MFHQSERIASCDPVRVMQLIDLAERGYVPKSVIRRGIRHLLRERLRTTTVLDPQRLTEQEHKLYEQLSGGPVAVSTEAANIQHYEVPAEFFQAVLGPRLKYSCCHFPTGAETLREAEEKMLQLTCQRAEIEDGMEILELGCGWGSLTLWLAETYPRCRITAVSNSRQQRTYITQCCRERGLSQVNVITADMRQFTTAGRFDRVVSIEMFEHMRNYALLLHRISSWLKPQGKLFVHIFCHRQYSYFFGTEGSQDWMGRHFFTGGIMPADSLLLHFQHDVALEHHWRVNGLHYQRTCEAWLRQQDAQRHELLALFQSNMSGRDARIQFQRWRIFFLACAELFRYAQGTEWYVAHYLFQNRGSRGS